MQSREDWFAEKFSWLKKSFIAFLIGIPFLIVGLLIQNDWAMTLLMIPFFIGFVWLLAALCFIPIIHWKDRYAGQKSNLWGFFLVFETSGWSKILYWFMHVLPDKKAQGPYTDLE